MEQQDHVNALSDVLMTFLKAMETTVNKRVEEKLAARVEEEMETRAEELAARVEEKLAARRKEVLGFFSHIYIESLYAVKQYRIND